MLPCTSHAPQLPCPCPAPLPGRCVRRATGKALRHTGGVMGGVVRVMTGGAHAHLQLRTLGSAEGGGSVASSREGMGSRHNARGM